MYRSSYQYQYQLPVTSKVLLVPVTSYEYQYMFIIVSILDRYEFMSVLIRRNQSLESPSRIRVRVWTAFAAGDAAVSFSQLAAGAACPHSDIRRGRGMPWICR